MKSITSAPAASLRPLQLMYFLFLILLLISRLDLATSRILSPSPSPSPEPSPAPSPEYILTPSPAPPVFAPPYPLPTTVDAEMSNEVSEMAKEKAEDASRNTTRIAVVVMGAAILSWMGAVVYRKRRSNGRRSRYVGGHAVALKTEQNPTAPDMSSNPAAMLLPPGFRFHPTDEELILHYLANRAAAQPCPAPIIAEVDIYKFDPWDLPAKAWFGDKEWYFFSPRDRKYPNGLRPNRSAGKGYWKATGTDKPIASSKGNGNIGVKKVLVFYTGKPPKGTKTDWIMHEYLLSQAHKKMNNNCKAMKLRDSSTSRLDNWVLCRIHKRSSSHEAEKETSTSADDVGVSITASPPRTTTLLRDSILNLPKSYSLSELLSAVDCPEISQLLEHPYDALGLWNNSFSQDLSNSCFQIETLSPVSVSEINNSNSLKRPFTTNYCFQDGPKMFPAEKKARTETNLNLTNHQSFFNQHVVVSGSHLG
ncbi:hypothetical protein ZIOFF_027831 [Zingiber officinale]|uniref:NAC domain-containing protein n=1 Tax=Zingiber officinale TaxID=94328 RepID=A0A8J5GZ10_ZINOF|nr:hypothetical protein ZIOFF_027831 [Zingiber officinale]